MSGSVDLQVYGRGDVARYLQDVSETWIESEQLFEGAVPVDERRLLATLRFRGVARASGIPAEQVLGALVEFEDDLIRRIDVFPSPDAARAAA
jgi:hypothetical protein